MKHETIKAVCGHYRMTPNRAARAILEAHGELKRTKGVPSIRRQQIPPVLLSATRAHLARIDKQQQSGFYGSRRTPTLP